MKRIKFLWYFPVKINATINPEFQRQDFKDKTKTL